VIVSIMLAMAVGVVLFRVPLIFRAPLTWM